jgi:hypothetical protein
MYMTVCFNWHFFDIAHAGFFLALVEYCASLTQRLTDAIDRSFQYSLRW